jgi:hypothetical protein
MRRRRSTLTPALFALALAGCGGSLADKASKTLATSLAATNAARDSFVSWDEKHQLAIVDEAGSREAGEVALKSYRGKRQKVIYAFTVAYTTIAAAATLIPLIEAGEKKDADLTRLVLDAVVAATAIKDAIAAIQGDP